MGRGGHRRFVIARESRPGGTTAAIHAEFQMDCFFAPLLNDKQGSPVGDRAYNEAKKTPACGRRFCGREIARVRCRALSVSHRCG